MNYRLLCNSTLFESSFGVLEFFKVATFKEFVGFRGGCLEVSRFVKRGIL